MSRSPLQLEDFWITRLDFRAKEDHSTEEAVTTEPLPRLTWEIATTPADSYSIKLRVSENSPRYHLLVDVTGIFSFKQNTTDQTRELMIAVNGPSILYGIVRGVVSGISGMSQAGRSAMPSINIVALNQRRERQRARRTTTDPE